MVNIIVEKQKEVKAEEIEMVERKGLGHPDTLCDLVVEAASQELSRHYLKNFGKVLHHNVDKGVLIGGRSKPKFGGGKILEPIKILIVGRVTDCVENKKIDVKAIVKKAAFAKLKEVFKKNVEKYFRVSLEYQSGALNLKQLIEEKTPLANDTSFGVAHTPFSLAEKIALFSCQFLNSSFPFLGPDIKVMVLRQKDNFSITVAAAYIDRFVKNVSDYQEKKERVKKTLAKVLQKKFKIKKFKIFHNTADAKNPLSEKDIYLTVLGTSAEHGDDGQVGRGNRVCGLITPNREMSLEAAAGKNINHPGKLYQILSFLIAQKIGKIKGVKECTVKILSQIGKPLNEPQVVHIKLAAKDFESTKNKAIQISNFYFKNLNKIQTEIVKKRYPIC